VSKHGLLTREHEDRSAWEQAWEAGTGKPTWIINQSPMRVETFRAEVQRAHGLLTLYAEIKAMNREAIWTRVANSSSVVDRILAREFAPGGMHEGSLDSLRDDPNLPVDFTHTLSTQIDLHYARHALGKSLADAVSSVRLRPRVPEPHPFLDHSHWSSDPPRGLAQSWDCPDLLSAIYLQFYLLVTNNKPMRRCENAACGMPFPVTRKGKRFCNATCRSNARHYRSP
jgi:hypothetical protein